MRRAGKGIDTELNAQIASFGWNWALWTTLLQVIDRFVLLVVGLVTVLYMVREMLRNRASGPEAA